MPNRELPPKHVWAPPKHIWADRVAAPSELGILVASCGFEAPASELYVREQLSFKVCSMWYLFAERRSLRWSQSARATFFLTAGENVYI